MSRKEPHSRPTNSLRWPMLSRNGDFLERSSKNGRKEIAGLLRSRGRAIDDQVGRLMRTLDELGLAEDTIFLFTSDHGNMLGSQEVGFVMQHMKPWDEAARVPGIVRYPRKVKPGQQLETFFSLVDMAPSLLSLCGVDIPKDMQGTDLSPVILGEKGEEPDSVFLPIALRLGVGGIGGEAWRLARLYGPTDTCTSVGRIDLVSCMTWKRTPISCTLW